MFKKLLKWVGFAALGAVLAFAVSRTSVLAIEIDGVEYNDNDYNKIVAFLKQPSSVEGKTNADILIWDIDSPNSWAKEDDEREFDWGVMWNDDNPKRVEFIDLDIDNFFTEESPNFLAGNLDLSGLTKLVSLNFNSNRISSLNLSGCTALTTIDCKNNGLSSIDVSENTKLEYFVCSYNKLTGLNLNNNTELEIFWCYDNKLTKLDLSKNTKLERFSCGKNKLKKLDVSKNIKLAEFHCFDNELTKLDLSKNKRLIDFGCQGNKLSQISVKLRGKQITLKAQGKGYVGLSTFYSRDVGKVSYYNNSAKIFATPKSGAKFVNWTDDGKVIFKTKKAMIKIPRLRNLVAKFK